MSPGAKGKPVDVAAWEAGAVVLVDGVDADERVDEGTEPPEEAEVGGVTPGGVEAVELGVVDADPHAATSIAATRRIDALMGCDLWDT